MDISVIKMRRNWRHTSCTWAHVLAGLDQGEHYLDADAATYTQRLWDPHDLALRGHLDTQLTCNQHSVASQKLVLPSCASRGRRACWGTHPCGPPGSSSCTPDGTSWACICHGWRWQSWCFYPPWWGQGRRTLAPRELHGEKGQNRLFGLSFLRIR